MQKMEGERAVEIQPQQYRNVVRKFAVYPKRIPPDKTEAAYLALGLASEAGEVADKIKKWIRDSELSRMLLLGELGDVLWYLDGLALAFGWTLEEVMEHNVRKLTARHADGNIKGSGDSR